MVLPSLFRKLIGSHPVRDDLQLILYTRQGCHLCDTAWEQLLGAQKRYGFRLEKQDVDSDVDLVERYGKCVPVVTVNGKVRFRGAVNPVLLRRLLTASQGSDPL